MGRKPPSLNVVLPQPLLVRIARPETEARRPPLRERLRRPQVVIPLLLVLLVTALIAALYLRLSQKAVLKDTLGDALQVGMLYPRWSGIDEPSSLVLTVANRSSAPVRKTLVIQPEPATEVQLESPAVVDLDLPPGGVRTLQVVWSLQPSAMGSKVLTWRVRVMGSSVEAESYPLSVRIWPWPARPREKIRMVAGLFSVPSLLGLIELWRRLRSLLF